MKSKLAVFVVLIFFSHISVANEFLEGKHYVVVSDGPAQIDRGVVEYFSYSCPGCFAIEPYILDVKSQLSPSIIHRVHVPFGGRKPKLSQQAHILTKLLHAEHLDEKIFSRIHLGKGAFKSQDALINFFQDHGFDRKKVESVLNSFSAKTLIGKMNKDAKENGIGRIPAIIINNKYQINNSAIASADMLGRLVSYLNTLP